MNQGRGKEKMDEAERRAARRDQYLREAGKLTNATVIKISEDHDTVNITYSLSNPASRKERENIDKFIAESQAKRAYHLKQAQRMGNERIMVLKDACDNSSQESSSTFRWYPILEVPQSTEDFSSVQIQPTSGSGSHEPTLSLEELDEYANMAHEPEKTDDTSGLELRMPYLFL